MRERYDLCIDALEPGGAGLGPEGVLVADALPGDRVLARRVSRAKNPIRAVVEQWRELSPDRREAPCALSRRCGACAWMAGSDEAQLRWKLDMARRALGEWGEVSGIRPSPATFGYRNRALLPFGKGPKLGYYEPRSHRIVDVPACPVLIAPLAELLPRIREILWRVSPPPYEEENACGLLRRIALRGSERTGEVLVTVVAPRAGGMEELCAALKAELPERVSLALNLQPSRGNAVFGSETRILRGGGSMRERIRGHEVRLRSTTFFQLNTAMAEALYARVAERAGALEGAKVADLYGGIGLLGLELAAAGAARVVVVETGASSLDEARRLAHGRPALEIQQGSVPELLPRLGPLDLVVTDPPRRGLGKEGVSALLQARPARIVHIACSLVALTRDLRALLAGPYRLEDSIELFDMLPQTPHVEALAVLARI